jgi:predicted nuclease with RNAse H fold
VNRAAGVDVGVKKGCDLVVLEGRNLVAHHAHLVPAELPALLARYRPGMVAIDSPPAYAMGGPREAERELLRRGIGLFVTPDPARGTGNPWYDWMRVGFACFAAVAESHPRYRDGPFAGHACETFPHATSVVLRGSLRDRAESKLEHRRAVLVDAGVDTSRLRGIDAVDAALCALTGVLALEGEACVLGDPDEGVILLPSRRVEPRYVSTR